MNILKKLPHLIFASLLLILIASALFNFRFKKNLGISVGNLQTTRLELEKRRVENERLIESNERLKKDIERLQESVEAEKRTAGSFQLQNVQAHREIVQMNVNLTRLEKERDELGREIHRVKRALIEVETRSASEIKRESGEAYEARIAALTDQIESLNQKFKPAIHNPVNQNPRLNSRHSLQPQFPLDGVPARIVEISPDYSTIGINIGRSTGLASGDKVNIQQDGHCVAVVEVTQVTEKFSVGRILSSSESPKRLKKQNDFVIVMENKP